MFIMKLKNIRHNTILSIRALQQIEAIIDDSLRGLQQLFSLYLFSLGRLLQYIQLLLVTLSELEYQG